MTLEGLYYTCTGKVTKIPALRLTGELEDCCEQVLAIHSDAVLLISASHFRLYKVSALVPNKLTKAQKEANTPPTFTKHEGRLLVSVLRTD